MTKSRRVPVVERQEREGGEYVRSDSVVQRAGCDH